MSSTKEHDSEWPEWQSESMQRFSDWKIIVTHACVESGCETRGGSRTKQQGQDVYHTHRVVLAAGARRSGYFSALFDNTSTAEHQDNTSRIDLNPLQAKLFPKLLEFVYTGQLNDIEPADTVHLFAMANYFDMPALKERVFRHCREDTDNGQDFDKVIYYLGEFDREESSDHELYDFVIQELCTKIHEIDENRGDVIKPHWLLDILTNNIRHRDVLAQAANRLVPRCLSKHQESIDVEMADKLVDFVDTETVSPQSAVRLLFVIDTVDQLYLEDKEEEFDHEDVYRAFRAGFADDENWYYQEIDDDTKKLDDIEELIKDVDIEEFMEDENSTFEEDQNEPWTDYRRQELNGIVIDNWQTLSADEEMKDLIPKLDGKILFAMLCQANEDFSVVQPQDDQLEDDQSL